jgi:hypothetical protein
MRLPLLGTQLLVKVLLLACSSRGYLALTRLRVLNKSAVLLVELAQDTNCSTLVNYTATLTATASITGTLAAGSDAGEADSSDRSHRGDGANGGESGWLEVHKVLLSRNSTARLRASSSDRDGTAGVWTRHSRLYCNGHGHSNCLGRLNLAVQFGLWLSATVRQRVNGEMVSTNARRWTDGGR